MRTPLLCAAIVGLLLFSGVGATGATVRTGAFSVAPISKELAARMTGVSWRPGCPVPLRDLRVVTASYRGFDGRGHTGRIVVHRDVARGVLTVLRRLYAAGFPIRRMVPVDAYGGSDFRSIEADNTSAFNCRMAPLIAALVLARLGVTYLPARFFRATTCSRFCAA